MGKLKAQVVPNALITRLREAVQPRGKKAMMLRDLPDAVLVDIYQRLRLGQAAHHIADYMQKKRNLFTDVPTVSLANIIQLFKRRTIPELVQVKQEIKEQPEIKKAVSKRVEQVHKKLDAMSMLADINHELYDRFKSLRVLEKESLESEAPFNGKETLATFRELKIGIHDYIEKQFKLGILETKPSQHLIQFDATFTQLVKQLPDKGAGLPQIAERLCEITEDGDVELEAFPDGTYRIRNKE